MRDVGQGLLLFVCQVLLIQAHGNTALEKDSGCGRTKGCFSGCSGEQCYEASWEDKRTYITFTLKTVIDINAEQYVAIGFSEDNEMASDSVVGCIYKDGTVKAYNSYNVDGGKNNVPIVQNRLGLSGDSGTYEGGVLTCTFNRLTNPSNPLVFDLNTEYYVLLAKGPITQNGQLTRHSLENLPLVTKKKVNFQSTEDLTGTAINVLVKVHGSLMVFAWVFAASIAIVLARFYKPVWDGRTILGDKYWFQFHRTLMVLATLAVIAGIVVIFVDVGKWSHMVGQSDWKRAHPYIGIIVAGVVLINPLMALFRPHPDDKYRYIFNWAHWAVGTVGHLLAVLNIFIGIDLPATQAPDWLIIVLACYAGYQILFEIFMEIYDNCCNDGAKHKSEMYELKEKSGYSGAEHTVRQDDKGKIFLLGLHLLIILGFSVALIVVIVIS